MRYMVEGHEVRTENTARSTSQTSRYLQQWITGQDMVDEALDFGCGKLRYSSALASRARRLTLVDSAEQLGRKQVIAGSETTIHDYAHSHFHNVRILTYESYLSDELQYDFVLCAFVLSAIPILAVRDAVLRCISERLKASGRCLFVTQFSDSYFKRYASSTNARPHRDGWLRVTPKGNYYYGIISRDRLEEIVWRHDFTICDSWTVGHRYAYVLAGRAPSQPILREIAAGPGLGPAR